MPQIDQIGTIYASQLVWLLLVFAIIYFVIGRGMVSKIEGTVDARNGRIEGDLAAADAARAQAEATDRAYRTEMEKAHADAHAAVQAAKDQAARDAQDRLRAAQEDVAVRTAHAEAALAEARARALGEVETVAADAVCEIVARLAGAQVSEDEARAAVSRSLSQAA